MRKRRLMTSSALKLRRPIDSGGLQAKEEISRALRMGGSGEDGALLTRSLTFPAADTLMGYR